MSSLGKRGERAVKNMGEKIDWLDRVDVIDFLEQLELNNVSQASGDEVVCSCPWPGHTHGDRKPSLYMNDGSREKHKATAFKCHGCNRVGNAITLLAYVENISNQQARTLLRETYAPDWRAPRGGSITKEIELWLQEREEAEAEATEAIELPVIPWERYDNLMGFEWPEGAGASDFPGTPAEYIYERGFTSKTLNEWRIGYDEISDRLCIPVCNEFGELIGVKGRTTDPDIKPKYRILGDKIGRRKRYKFYPYEKSLVVFGIDRIIKLETDLKIVVFCEGELDVIALWQVGIPAICTGSAHVSDEQARIIRDHCDGVVVFFDTNTAGLNATWGYYNEDSSDYHPGLVYKLAPFIPTHVVRDHRYDPAEMVALDKVEALRRMIDNAVIAHRHPNYAMIPSDATR